MTSQNKGFAWKLMGNLTSWYKLMQRFNDKRKKRETRQNQQSHTWYLSLLPLLSIKAETFKGRTLSQPSQRAGLYDLRNCSVFHKEEEHCK